MFKVNYKNGACLILGVCGPTTVINACSGKSIAWDKAGISGWLKDKLKLQDNKQDKDDKAIGDLAENLSKNEAVDTLKLKAVNDLYKCTGDSVTHIINVDNKLVDAGKDDPDKKKYGGKKGYKVTCHKDAALEIEQVEVPKEG